jgi:hypothetical protein
MAMKKTIIFICACVALVINACSKNNNLSIIKKPGVNSPGLSFNFDFITHSF